MKKEAIILRNWFRNSKFEADPTYWFIVFALLAAGLVMVYSSSFIFAQERYGNGLYFFKRHLIFTIFGLLAFGIGWKLSVDRLRSWVFPLFLISTTLLICTFIPGLSHRAGGAKRWVNLLGLTFQPSEFAKLAILIFVATQISKKEDRQENWRSGFLTYFLGAIPLYALLLLQPDFGTVALLLGTTVLMIFAGGVRLKYLIVTFGALVPTVCALILSSAYRRARVFSFLDPWSDPAHRGFQIIQSLLAFFSGRWLGVGLGNSKEKLFYLPEAHNDFIFAVVGEELGLVGVVFFVSLFFILVWKSLKATQRLDLPFERALATGIGSLIGLQAFFNMAVVLGLLPTKGLPLPLISYGGTSLLVIMFMLGVLAQLVEKSK